MGIPSPRKLFPSTQNVLLSPMFPRGLWLISCCLASQASSQASWKLVCTAPGCRRERFKVGHSFTINSSDWSPARGDVLSSGLAASLMEIRNARLGQTNGPFGHSTVWQRHPEAFCRKELHVPPMKSVIKNVRKPLCSRSSLWPSQLPWAPPPVSHFIQVSTLLHETRK